jgi:alcohol dehydrogenase class IV
LAHPLGAVFDAHHGTLNAILMPYVLKANRNAIEDRITRLSRYLGLEAGFDPFLQWILELRTEINIPHTLQEIGIGDDRLTEIGGMAVDDPSAGTNPILFDAATYTEIAANTVHGRL